MTWLGRLITASGDTSSPFRDGFLGIGGSGAKTDRGNQLAGVQSQWNIFNSGLGLEGQQNTTGQQQQAQGQTSLNDASNYWKGLLSAGRTQTAADAAPAINAAEAGSDAAKRQQAQFGTGRSGGTVGGNQQADTVKQGNIDDIINQNLVGGRSEAAKGLAGAGSTDLYAGSTSIAQALQSLGISGTAGANIMNNGFNSYQYTNEQQKQMGASAGQAAAQLALAFL